MAALDVRPPLSADDPAYYGWRDPVTHGQVAVCDGAAATTMAASPGGVFSPDRTHGFVGDLCERVSDSARNVVTTLSVSIDGVVKGRASPQVGRVYAQGCVAPMEHPKTWRYGSVSKCIGESMRGTFRRGILHPAVVGTLRPSPKPTLTQMLHVGGNCPVCVNLRKEALGDRAISRLPAGGDPVLEPALVVSTAPAATRGRGRALVNRTDTLHRVNLLSRLAGPRTFMRRGAAFSLHSTVSVA